MGVADGDGGIDLWLAGRDGRAVVSRPGDVLELSADGGTASVRVEPLTFDFDPATGLVGTAPRDRPVWIALTLGNGRVVRLAWTSDAGGRLRYGPADVSVRAGWSLADVVGVRVELPTSLMPPQPSGHLMVAESAGPSERHAPVYLPFALSPKPRGR